MSRKLLWSRSRRDYFFKPGKKVLGATGDIFSNFKKKEKNAGIYDSGLTLVTLFPGILDNCQLVHPIHERVAFFNNALKLATDTWD